MTRAATIYIANSPLAGTNMTLTNSHSLWVDNGSVYIDDTTFSQSATGGALIVSGSIGAKNITLGKSTFLPNWGTIGCQLATIANNYINNSTAASGTTASAVITNFASCSIAASNSNVSCTRAATVYINDAPTAGTNMTLTNSHALWINNGSTYLSGAISSSSQSTGTLIVGGGIGCGGDIWCNILSTVSGIVINTATASQTAWQTITGDGANWLDGSFTICQDFYGSNSTPVKGAIQIHNGANGTSTNSMFIGTMSSNDLRFGTADSTRVTITSAGRFGVGTSTPQAWMEISGSVSSTIGAAGLGYGALTKSQTTFTIGPLSSIAVSLKTSNSILINSGSFITTSDRRLKTNIEDIVDTTEFVRNVNPKLFSYRSSPDRRDLGYIAQDVAKYSIECISLIENESLKAEQEGDIDRVQLTLDYPKIACLLHKCLQNVLKRLDVIAEKLEH